MDEVLYILMRNDLPSMNAGKAMAQASHASNQAMKTYGDTIDGKAWRMQTRSGFGTVLVLSASLAQINEVVRSANANGRMTEVVVDPSYPYRTNAELAALIPTNLDTVPRVVNGDSVTLWRKEVTCAFLLGKKSEVEAYVKDLSLHP